MKLRQHRRHVLTRMYNAWARPQPWVVVVPPHLCDALMKRLREEEIQRVEETKQEFVCQKVKDGSVVDTFDTREEALALVLKHARGKKAKLQVIDSSTGELVLFTEDEQGMDRVAI